MLYITDQGSHPGPHCQVYWYMSWHTQHVYTHRVLSERFITGTSQYYKTWRYLSDAGW